MAGDEWEQARAYVEQLREQGRTDGQIRQIMLKGGWTQEQLKELFAGEVPPAPAPPPASVPTPGRRPRRPARAADMSGYAKAGIILVSILAPLAGFIWGVIYLFSQQAAKKRWGAWGLAISVLFGLGHAALLFPLVATRGWEQPKQAACLSNMKLLALGVTMYCVDWGERMPDAAKWQDQIDPYVKNRQIFECPEGGTYAMNDKLSGKTVRQIFRMGNPARIILLYEVDSKGERLYDVHGGRANYAYVAGNVASREKPE